VKKGDRVYRVVECDPAHTTESTWAVTSVELAVATAKRHVFATPLSGLGGTHYAPRELGRLYFATPDEAIEHFVAAKRLTIKNAKQSIKTAERALSWAIGKTKICSRCVYANRKATYRCRECEAACCEHLCSFKSVPKGAGELNAATCSTCSRENILK
jgi:hypothetical protein